MKRRNAIKNIGLSLGGLALTPTAISLLQSCQSSETYMLEYFTQDEFTLVKRIADIILPKTDTPSASELKIPEFIDGYITHVAMPNDTVFMKRAMAILSKKLMELSGKEKLSKVGDEHIVSQLSFYLKATDEQKEEWGKVFYEYTEGLEKDEEDNIIVDEATLPQEEVVSMFLSHLRWLTVSAFKNTEYIGEEVLAYAPVPGQQKGCVDLEETTQGKAWSL